MDRRAHRSVPAWTSTPTVRTLAWSLLASTLVFAMCAALAMVEVRQRARADAREALTAAVRVTEALGTPLPSTEPPEASLDRRAADLARVTGLGIAILDTDRLLAWALRPRLGPVIETAIRRRGSGRRSPSAPTIGVAREIVVDGERFAVAALHSTGGITIYGLISTDARIAAAYRALAAPGVLLAALLVALSAGTAYAVSLFLVDPARRLADAIDEVTWSPAVTTELPQLGAPGLQDVTTAVQELLAARLRLEAGTREACTATIRAIASALDARNVHMLGHSDRVSALAVAIGRTLSLDDAQLDVIRLGALLHDIGNIAIPDAILNKTGPLTAAEYDLVKTHAALGARILRPVPFLALHIPIVELHHERPDGTGYPYGLQTSATPLPARIVRVADAYDAMTSTRAYREAMTPEEAIAELWRCAGTGYDAAVVDALVMTLSGSPAGAIGRRVQAHAAIGA